MMATYDGLAAYAMLVLGIDVDQISDLFVETILKGLEENNDKVSRSH